MSPCPYSWRLEGKKWKRGWMKSTHKLSTGKKRPRMRSPLSEQVRCRKAAEVLSCSMCSSSSFPFPFPFTSVKQSRGSNSSRDWNANKELKIDFTELKHKRHCKHYPTGECESSNQWINIRYPVLLFICTSLHQIAFSVHLVDGLLHDRTEHLTTWTIANYQLSQKMHGSGKTPTRRHISNTTNYNVDNQEKLRNYK